MSDEMSRASVRRWFAALPRFTVWVGVAPAVAFFALGCIEFPGVLLGSLFVLAISALTVAGRWLFRPYSERLQRARDARDAMDLLRKVEQQTEVVLVETGAPYRGGQIRIELPVEPARPTALQRTKWLLLRQPDPLADRLALENEAEEMEEALTGKMRP
jgi:HAMP domain-containing protein